MSAEDPVVEAPAGRRRARKQAKTSLWQKDLSSLGRKDDQDGGDERIERPPFEPTLPQADLLPASVRESMSVSRIRRVGVLAAVLLVLLVGGVWWLQGSTIDTAQADLDRATAENARLRGDLDALTPVKQMYEQITRLQGVVTTTLASQPEAAVVLTRLAEAGVRAGDGDITFASAEVDYHGLPTPDGDLNPCPDPDPFGNELTIGCLTFNATATDRDQVSAFLRILDEDPLFVGPYVTSSSIATLEGGGSTVSFAGSAGVSLEALETLLTPEQVEALLTPPAKEPAPSASPGAGEGTS